MAKVINEGSGCTITARYYGNDGRALSPATVRWRLKDITNNRVLRDWSSITPSGTSDTITVPASLNAIYDDRRQYQDHALSVEANVGLDNQFASEITYKVKNLSAFRTTN